MTINNKDNIRFTELNEKDKFVLSTQIRSIITLGNLDQIDGEETETYFNQLKNQYGEKAVNDCIVEFVCFG